MRLASITLLVFTITTTAMAQSITQSQMSTRYPDIILPWPKTVPWTDANGAAIGTVTFWTNRMYLRDAKGELIAQVIVEGDGTKALLDPSGKVLDKQLPGKLPQQSE